MNRLRAHFVFMLFGAFVGNVNAIERKLEQKDFPCNNYEYVISDTCNLFGKNISIPKGCIIKFKKKGCIKNGVINFNGTKLRNPKFIDCRYSGDVIMKGDITDSVFCKGTEFDNDVLWWLIEQTANNGTTLELTKDYFINSSRVFSKPYQQDNRSYVVIESKSFTIKGNKHTIFDTHQHKGHFNKDFMVLVGCNNVKVESLYFEGLYNEVNNIAKEGVKDFPPPGGTNVILCVGDTKGIKIVDGKCKHCFSYIWCGCDPQVPVEATNRNYYNDNLVVKGFEDVDVEVDAFDTQYPVAVFKGKKIKVRLHFLYARRGCRLQGVEDADISIEGAFATTPVMLLLKDAISYSDKTFTNRIYNACSNIEAKIERLNVEDKITKYRWYDIALNLGCYGSPNSNTFSQFVHRCTSYSFRNINVSYSCGVQQYAILFSPERRGSISDEYELNLSMCSGGGLTDAEIENVDRRLKLNIIRCNLKAISMFFNSQDEISILKSSVMKFTNKRASSPSLKEKNSKVIYVK